MDNETVRQTFPLLLVVLDAGDPVVRHDAVASLPQLDELGPARRLLVLRAAILDKPSFADELLRELPDASAQRRQDIALAIEGAPDLIDLLQRHHKELAGLPRYLKRRLIGRRCDEARRDDIEQLARALLNESSRAAVRELELCVAQRKALEPELQAFFNAKP